MPKAIQQAATNFLITTSIIHNNNQVYFRFPNEIIKKCYRPGWAEPVCQESVTEQATAAIGHSAYIVNQQHYV